MIDLNLSLVDVVQDILKLCRADSIKTEQRMRVFVGGEEVFEVINIKIFKIIQNIDN